MAAQQPTTGSAPKTLLVRGRLKTPGQMKAFVHDAVGLHLLGQYPYKTKDDLIAALNAADPNGAVWNRQRLEYYVKKIRGKKTPRASGRWPTLKTAVYSRSSGYRPSAYSFA